MSVACRPLMRIAVSEHVSLTEIRPGDKPALVEHLKEKEISENTLRIPFPYSDTDADAFLKHVEESEREHGEPVHFAIRNAVDYLIGGLGFMELHVRKPDDSSP